MSCQTEPELTFNKDIIGVECFYKKVYGLIQHYHWAGDLGDLGALVPAGLEKGADVSVEPNYTLGKFIKFNFIKVDLAFEK